MTEKFLFQLTTEDAINAIAQRVMQLMTNHPAPQPESQAEETPINITETCKLLGISKPTLHAWMAKGIIPFYRKGRRVYLFKSEVLESLETSKRRGK